MSGGGGGGVKSDHGCTTVMAPEPTWGVDNDNNSNSEKIEKREDEMSCLFMFIWTVTR